MKKILFVDDEPNILAAFQRQLRKQFSLETAVGPAAGLALLENWRDYAVVVADMQMPEMTGVEFLVKVRELSQDIVLMMLTGNADQATAMDAINRGSIFRFLSKPCSTEQLTAALEAGLLQHQFITAERELLENTLSGSIKVLTEILAMVEPKSFGQAETLRNRMRVVARVLKLSQTWELEAAALLSQIGSVTLPPEMLLKARLGHLLAPREQEMFQRVPTIGADLLTHIPRLDEVCRIIRYQNQNFDGSGYPGDGVSGEQIPLGARMLKALVDFGQLEAKGSSIDEALRVLSNRSEYYDPHVLSALGEAFHLDSRERKEITREPRAVTFAALRVGHVLTADLETKDGVLILSAGNRITPPLIQRLRNFAALSGIKEPIHIEG